MWVSVRMANMLLLCSLLWMCVRLSVTWILFVFQSLKQARYLSGFVFAEFMQVLLCYNKHWTLLFNHTILQCGLLEVFNWS